MIELGKQDKNAPRLFNAPQIPLGKVYVQTLDGQNPVSQLVPKKKVVLTTDGGRRELRTLTDAEGIGKPPGTYLNGVDYESFAGERDNPKLRLYGLGDAWGKVKSGRGILLILTTVLGALVAVFGMYLLIAGESATTSSAVAERAQSLVRWVAEPASVDGAEASEIDRKLRKREARAQRCLTSLRGGEADISEAGGVNCAIDTPSFLRNKESGALFAALVGVLTALLSVVSLRDKFSFGKEPA